LPGTKAVIPTALTFDKEVWLGVGSGEFLKSDFEIDGIAGIRHDGKNWLQVQLRNTGQTPIRPKGEVEVVDPLFAQRRFDPVKFSSPTIDLGKRSRTEIEAPLGMTDGKWKILVTARQGSIEKTVIYEQDISFDNSTSEFFGLWRRLFGLPWLRWSLILLALAGIVGGWRMIRSGGKGRPPDEPQAESSEDPKPEDGSPAQFLKSKESEMTSNLDLAPSNLPDKREVGQLDSEALADDHEFQAEKLVTDPNQLMHQDETSTTNRIVVHVAGAVKSPGMYEVDEDSRVGDVIELAGGAWVLADLASINLARRVIDGEQIVVPTRTVSASPRVSTPPGLNLNRATEQQLSEVPGISAEIAREIVALRKRVVRFTDLAQLLEVRGIGPKKLDALRKSLFV
jgi:competence protein ComEA